MKRQEIKELLDYNLLLINTRLNKGTNSAYYNFDCLYDILDHLRNILVVNEKRHFIKYLSQFNGVKWWKEKSSYNLTTYQQERTTQEILNRLKGCIK